MVSPLLEASGAQSSAPVHNLTPRQRIEAVLDQLPTAGTALNQARSSQSALGSRELVEPIQRINEVMRHYGVQFELGDTRAGVVTRIIDRESGELIRQIPGEEVIRVAERLDELQGRLINLEA